MQAAELGSPAAIGFGAVGARGAESDAAPDNGQWSFRLREVVRIRSIDARFAPVRPAAGRALRVTGATARLSDGARRSGRATCEARLARAKLRGSLCSWRQPADARGKALAVTVRVRVAGVGAATRVYRFRVR